MKTKKRAFTLVELLVVVAISAVLLLIATDRFVGDSFRANATYNQRVDVQTGVKTSMDNIKNILKRSVQVHLVGKEVYMEDMNLQRLDTKYNYIGFRKDNNGNRFLANIVYDKASRKFNVLPLTAGDKKDIMTGDKISYNLEFYKNDNNYRKKLENDMLHITITGKSSAHVLGKGINDQFELSEDIQLPNVNQILLSRHLQGGIDKITALAYDNGLIQPGKNKGRAGFVFVMDSSASMKFTMAYKYPFKMGHDRYQLGYSFNSGSYNRWHVEPRVYTEADVNGGNPVASTRKAVLGNAMADVMLTKAHSVAMSANQDLEAYLFDYNYGLQDYSKNLNTFEIDNPTNHSIRYFTTLNMARKRGYGPINLKTSDGFNKAVDLVKNKANMKLAVSDHTGNTPAYGQATNTGFGILTGLEILQQMKDDGVEKRFLILLTDGNPTVVTDIDGFSYSADSRPWYNSLRATSIKRGSDYTSGADAMAYIRRVTNPTNGNNPRGLFEKAYLIGLSERPWEISKLGIIDPNDPSKQDPAPSDSINAYLRQTNNKVEAYSARSKESLEKIFEKIVEDIAISMGVFDGPDKMK